MPSKGIELPVNSVIIIALAIFVLLMLAAFFGKSGSELDKTAVNTAFNQGCSQLSSSYNCDYEKVSEIKTPLVINRQAKTLLDICRMSFNDPSKSALKCKFACPTCPKRVTEGSPCEDDNDCESSLTAKAEGWQCCTELPLGILGEESCKVNTCHNPRILSGQLEANYVDSSGTEIK
jgi:hypothetical protein